MALSPGEINTPFQRRASARCMARGGLILRSLMQVSSLRLISAYCRSKSTCRNVACSIIAIDMEGRRAGPVSASARGSRFWPARRFLIISTLRFGIISPARSRAISLHCSMLPPASGREEISACEKYAFALSARPAPAHSPMRAVFASYANGTDTSASSCLSE